MFERYMSKLMITPKTSIGGYVFDIYPSINHTLTATITSHPVQYGANISDHKFDEPDQLVFQIGMSDASQDLVSGQFSQRGKKLFTTAANLFLGYTFGKNKRDILKDLKSDLLNVISDSRSVNAFIVLNQLKVEGIPLTCVTRLRTYNNMIIQSVVADDTNETKNGLRATVTMREILLTNPIKVQVTSSAQITQTTDKGSQNTLPFESSLYREATK